MYDNQELLWPFPDVSWIIKSHLAIGARPGYRPDPHPQIVTQELFANRYIDALKQVSIKHIVCLLTARELQRYYDFSLLDLYREKGFELFWHPMDITSPVDILEVSVNSAAQHLNTLVHCAGGAQRSGLVAVCVIGRIGIASSPEEAIRFVTRQRGFNLHLMPTQVNLIEEFFSNL